MADYATRRKPTPHDAWRGRLRSVKNRRYRNGFFFFPSASRCHYVPRDNVVRLQPTFPIPFSRHRKTSPFPAVASRYRLASQQISIKERKERAISEQQAAACMPDPPDTTTRHDLRRRHSLARRHQRPRRTRMIDRAPQLALAGRRMDGPRGFASSVSAACAVWSGRASLSSPSRRRHRHQQQQQRDVDANATRTTGAGDAHVRTRRRGRWPEETRRATPQPHQHMTGVRPSVGGGHCSCVRRVRVAGFNNDGRAAIPSPPRATRSQQAPKPLHVVPASSVSCYARACEPPLDGVMSARTYVRVLPTPLMARGRFVRPTTAAEVSPRQYTEPYSYVLVRNVSRSPRGIVYQIIRRVISTAMYATSTAACTRPSAIKLQH
nr:unnamed protein product [Digitaria exilis]